MDNRKIIALRIEVDGKIKDIICNNSLKEVQKAIFKETGQQYTLKECDSFIEDRKYNDNGAQPSRAQWNIVQHSTDLLTKELKNLI